ncbi:hypothetical protein [Aerococcus urinae]
MINEKRILFDFNEEHQNAFLSNKIPSGKYKLNSIMDFSKAKIISKKIMKSGYVNISYMLSLDSNVLGDLKKSLEENINTDLLSMITLAKNENMVLDFNPYLVESILNNYIFEDEVLYKSIEAFNTADSFNPIREDCLRDTYERHREYILRDTESKFNAIKKNYNPSNLKAVRDYYYYAYVLLLKTFLIKFDTKIKSNNKKIDALIEFITSNLGIYGENEFVIAVFGIRNHKTLSKFLSLQLNSKHKLDKIRGMAWDLAHIRYLEMMMMAKTNIQTICLPYFLSADKGLSQSISLNPVKRIIITLSNEGNRATFRRRYNAENIGLKKPQIDKIKEWRFSKKEQLTISEYKTLSLELEKEFDAI